jgi:hypothetical protein
MRRGRLLVRSPALIIAACLLAGCAADVVMVNPRTGEAAMCKESLQGLNPWSQKEACIGDYIARGWRRGSQE